MKILKNLIKHFTPFQILVSGYFVVTLIGAVLLSLPVSSTNHTYQPFIDSLFLATSGISTSGLSVVDIGTYYTLFGQIVLMIIFQIGGIGYMSFIIFFMYLFGIEMSLINKFVASESISGTNYRILGKFFIAVLLLTFIFELIGAVILTISWCGSYSMKHSIYLAIFHSISTFCTAGFSLFPDSLMRYNYSIPVNTAVNILSLIGGIGFIVLYDILIYIMKIIKNKKPRRLSTHSKFVVSTTFFIVIIATVIILFSEKWQSSMSFFQKITVSLFQVISASTTDGYNTIDIGKMGSVSLIILIILMFIGASPGSTGGGVKISTFGLMMVFLYHLSKGRESNINIFKREIPAKTVLKAFGVVLWFIVIFLIDLIIMGMTEKGTIMQVAFEIMSALGNTGLSTGITSSLTFTGKALLIITMFIGRVGPLTFGYAVFGRQKKLLYRYAEEDIYVG